MVAARVRRAPVRTSRAWHESASQIASSVEKRIAHALPVLRIERLASGSPIRSASSVSVIRRSWRRSSSLTTIAMSHRPFEVVAHARAFREHAGQQERQEDGEPAVDRKTGIQCAGVDTALPMAPMTTLSSCSASSAQAIACKRCAFAATNGSPARTVSTIASSLEDDVVQRYPRRGRARRSRACPGSAGPHQAKEICA